MPSDTTIIFLLVYVPMLVEARRATRNARALRVRGAVEPPGDVYAIMRIAYPAAFLVMMLEGAYSGTPAASVAVGGGFLFVIAKTLKWWAILALGPCWTFRLLVAPGTQPVVSGPYRWLRHPNYLAVVGELVAVALMSGARVAGPIATAAFGLLILKRIAVENRALGAILRRN